MQRGVRAVSRASPRSPRQLHGLVSEISTKTRRRRWRASWRAAAGARFLAQRRRRRSAARAQEDQRQRRSPRSGRARSRSSAKLLIEEHTASARCRWRRRWRGWSTSSRATIARYKRRAGVVDFADLLVMARDLLRDDAAVRGDGARPLRRRARRRIPGHQPGAGRAGGADRRRVSPTTTGRGCSSSAIASSRSTSSAAPTSPCSRARRRARGARRRRGAADAVAPLGAGAAGAVATRCSRAPWSARASTNGRSTTIRRAMTCRRCGRRAGVRRAPSSSRSPPGRAPEPRGARGAGDRAAHRPAARRGTARSARWRCCCAASPTLTITSTRCAPQGSPYFVVRGRGFFAAQEVRDLASALTVIDDPDDMLALVALLRSPIVGVSDETLARLSLAGQLRARVLLDAATVLPASLPPAERAGLERFRARFRELRLTADRLGPAACAQAIVDGADLVPLLAATRRRRAARGQPVRGWSRRRASSRASGGDLRAFATGCGARRRPAARRRRPQAQIADERDDVVRVMTVHQAKGLEFPVVFVPACGAMERVETMRRSSTTRPTGSGSSCATSARLRECVHTAASRRVHRARKRRSAGGVAARVLRGGDARARSGGLLGRAGARASDLLAAGSSTAWPPTRDRRCCASSTGTRCRRSFRGGDGGRRGARGESADGRGRGGARGGAAALDRRAAVAAAGQCHRRGHAARRLPALPAPLSAVSRARAAGASDVVARRVARGAARRRDDDERAAARSAASRHAGPPAARARAVPRASAPTGRRSIACSRPTATTPRTPRSPRCARTCRAFSTRDFARELDGAAVRRELPFLLSVPFDGGVLYLRGQIDLVRARRPTASRSSTTSTRAAAIPTTIASSSTPTRWRRAASIRRRRRCARGWRSSRRPIRHPRSPPAPSSEPFEAELAELGRTLARRAPPTSGRSGRWRPATACAAASSTAAIRRSADDARARVARAARVRGRLWRRRWRAPMPSRRSVAVADAAAAAARRRLAGAGARRPGAARPRLPARAGHAQRRPRPRRSRRRAQLVGGVLIGFGSTSPNLFDQVDRDHRRRHLRRRGLVIGVPGVYFWTTGQDDMDSVVWRRQQLTSSPP